MVFTVNQEQNKPNTFKDMLSQNDKSDFIKAMLKYVEAHDRQKHSMPMKKYEVNNKNQNKSGKMKTFISLWSFKLKRFPYGWIITYKSQI